MKLLFLVLFMAACYSPERFFLGPACPIEDTVYTARPDTMPFVRCQVVLPPKMPQPT